MQALSHMYICDLDTYNVKTLFHSGLRFLYTVCVCNRSLLSSTTQKGSLLPVRDTHTHTHTLTLSVSLYLPWCNPLGGVLGGITT